MDGRVSASNNPSVQLWGAQSCRALGGSLNGHTDLVNSVAFSADGKHIVSASNDKTVRIWDAQTGQPLAALHGHTGYVVSVAFSPDGKQIVSGSGSGDNTIRSRWDDANVVAGYREASDIDFRQHSYTTVSTTTTSLHSLIQCFFPQSTSPDLPVHGKIQHGCALHSRSS
jgi:WD40 repeat protein